ncbi:MAG TPA: FkbM family methyltransferase [Bryobacteraceae bacterium]
MSAYTGLYSGAKKSGLLNTRFGRWLFTSSYDAYKRHIEDPFHALIAKRPYLFQGGHAIDVGANIGYTSSLFARAIDPGFRVYAFEPDETNFGYLKERAERRENGGRIVPVRCAVGCTDGKIALWRNEHHHGDHRILTDQLREAGVLLEAEADWVPVTTIDTFVRGAGPLGPVSFIKIDVQGYEFPVCQGMEKTLSDNPGAIVALEFMPTAMLELGFDSDEMLAWWKSKGYAVSALSRSGDIRPGVPSSLGKSGYVDLLFSLKSIA